MQPNSECKYALLAVGGPVAATPQIWEEQYRNWEIVGKEPLQQVVKHLQIWKGEATRRASTSKLPFDGQEER